MSHFIKQIYKKKEASLKRAVFIDRDGTIIKEVSYLSDRKQIELIPGTIDGIRKLNRNGYVIIVISNQPVVARGLMSIGELKKINDALVELLRKNEVHVNAIYSCPHHPESHHPDIPKSAMKYRVNCECRKPKVAMLKKAIEDFDINLENVFIIGDRSRDIKTGDNLGIKTVLVKTGYGGNDKAYPVKPDYIVSDFNHAVDIVLKK